MLKGNPVRAGDWPFCLLLLACVVIGMLCLRPYLFINHDVAFLIWAADQVTGPPVYGRDILDANPPLCMLIYMPAVLLAKALGFEWGIRIWMMALTILSIVTLWNTAERPLRPVAAILAGFVVLAYPNHFAQREQIALLLCAPYVAGVARGRGWAVASGVMAGIGFLMKPHFLLPLALVFALRRRIRTEEYAILATGLAYGLSLLIFFQPYLFEMLPKAALTYGSIAFPALLLQQLAVIACMAGLLAFLSAPQAEARPYLMATAGFTGAALLQQKGFYYHFIPAFAFLAIYTAVSMRNGRALASRLAAVLLVIQGLFQAGLAVAWLRFEAGNRQFWAELNAEIDASPSYASLMVQPAGPQLIHTRSRYAGTAICQIFMPAVIAHLAGASTGNPEESERLAREQAIREIRRKPELVLISNTNHDGEYFDVLGWLNQDAAFRELWRDYKPTRHIAGVIIFRRR